MAVKLTMQGQDKVIANLSAALKRLGAGSGRRVGIQYTEPYAIFVHENMEAKHVVGQAKFLEQPMQEMKSQTVTTIARVLRSRKVNQDSIDEAIVTCATAILDRSKEIVPVDTGALKESGSLTEVESID